MSQKKKQRPLVQSWGGPLAADPKKVKVDEAGLIGARRENAKLKRKGN